MIKRPLSILLTTCIILIAHGCRKGRSDLAANIKYEVKQIPAPAIIHNPKTYVCYMAAGLNIDGVLNEDAWLMAEWTDYFVDIEGELKSPPLHSTRAKMMWDNKYFYIAAEISEPHIQARLRQRDTVIFYDNDFEVFIDPDGDTHGYYELELNAFNTVWDLLLTKPYRDKGNKVIDAWDISGLKSAVKIYGTLNDPGDIDEMWTVEIAIPMDVLSEWGNIPTEGAQWRINFSRVNWQSSVVNGLYQKTKDPETGKNLPEYNWVWSPQGLINMHYPEMWAYIQFTETPVGDSLVEFIYKHDESIKWELRELYYAQREYAAKKGSYTSFIKELSNLTNKKFDNTIEILVKVNGYEAYKKSEDSGLIWIINDDGRIYSLNQIMDEKTN